MPRPSELPPDQLRQFLLAFNDHPTFAAECLQIENLTGSVVPLELGAGQRKLSAAIAKQKNAGRPVRIVVLKTRRSWFTTGAMSEIFREVPFWPGRKGVIIADHYKPAGMEAFGYLEQFQKGYKPLTRYGAELLLPMLTKASQGEMEWDNHARIDVYSADSGEIRGGGRHFALFDEVAFWRAAEVTLTGAMNMVPKLPGTSIIVLSTANGPGGEFYDLCKQAQDPLSDTLFEFVFFGWLEHEGYKLPVQGDPAKFQASLDKDEIQLQRMHGATLEQLQWRRVTIATECRGKLDLFHQEYPTTAAEAFIATGRPALDLVSLSRHQVVNPVNAELQLIEEPTRKRLLLQPQPHGSLQIWKRPDAGRRYVIGADPSKGKDVSVLKRGANPDYSVAFVTDQFAGDQVAMLRDRLRPAPFADYLALLARYYNWAYICPESNDVGFMDALIRTGYPLELIYERDRDPSDRNPIRPEKLGFETTGLTRSWLVAAAYEASRDMTIQIHSAIVIGECQTFVVKPDGKPEHMDNHHDDCVFAYALCEIGRRSAPKKLPTLVEAPVGARITDYLKPKAKDTGW